MVAQATLMVLMAGVHPVVAQLQAGNDNAAVLSAFCDANPMSSMCAISGLCTDTEWTAGHFCTEYHESYVRELEWCPDDVQDATWIPAQGRCWAADGSDPCADGWRGVTCDDNSVVTELDLQGTQLEIIPAEIAHLTELVKLNARDNGLWALPPQIGELTLCLHLDVSKNQLTELPPEIGQLNDLRTL